MPNELEKAEPGPGVKRPGFTVHIPAVPPVVVVFGFSKCTLDMERVTALPLEKELLAMF